MNVSTPQVELIQLESFARLQNGLRGWQQLKEAVAEAEAADSPELAELIANSSMIRFRLNPVNFPGFAGTGEPGLWADDRAPNGRRRRGSKGRHRRGSKGRQPRGWQGRRPQGDNKRNRKRGNKKARPANKPKKKAPVVAMPDPSDDENPMAGIIAAMYEEPKPAGEKAAAPNSGHATDAAE